MAEQFLRKIFTDAAFVAKQFFGQFLGQVLRRRQMC